MTANIAFLLLALDGDGVIEGLTDSDVATAAETRVSQLAARSAGPPRESE